MTVTNAAEMRGFSSSRTCPFLIPVEVWSRHTSFCSIWRGLWDRPLKQALTMQPPLANAFKGSVGVILRQLPPAGLKNFSDVWFTFLPPWIRRKQTKTCFHYSFPWMSVSSLPLGYCFGGVLETNAPIGPPPLMLSPSQSPVWSHSSVPVLVFVLSWPTLPL